jgi:putative hydrolase of the HAD superfamily
VKKTYRHIFFDLDHTLWDFDKNSAEVLILLFRRYKLDQLNYFSVEEFVEKFKEVNYRLWDLYHNGEISKEKIRENRFRIIFEELNAPLELVPSTMADDYLQMCPLQKNVIPFTFELLDYLQDKYNLHIITNGFEDVQHIKLSSSGLLNYFETIITSETCGFIKPDKRMFEFALQKTGALAQESVMIGDNLDVDIAGALNAGLDAVYFNPFQMPHKRIDIREINCLSSLMDIL